MTEVNTAPPAEALTAELPGWLAAQRPTVVVIGDALLDGWLSGSSDRLCREAPAPVVDVTGESFAPGGAANTAANLAALGARVRMVSAVGTDQAGSRLVDRLAECGVDTGHVVRTPGRHTVSKQRIMAGEQLVARFDNGDGERLDPGEAEGMASATRAALRGADAVLVCDYELGVLGPEVGEVLADARPGLGLLAVDAHSLGKWRTLRPDVVTPNAGEAGALLGESLPAEPDRRLDALERHRERLHELTGAASVVVTLDRDGAALLSERHPVYRSWARPAPESHTAGAGDTFVAAFTVAACAGASDTLALELAQVAADIVVHRPATAVCDLAELEQRLGSYHDACVPHEQLERLLAEHRDQGRRVVLTNGCFDVLHRGHVGYLNQAKRLGDVLVVAVNSEVSLRKMGLAAANPVADRAAVLAALSCVDYVTSFDEDTAESLVRRARPDVYAKGGDYTPEMLTETPAVHEIGGEVRILDYVGDVR